VFDTVVLVIYGWKSVQPGTLSWAFPSLAAAVFAAHAMTNAVRWAIVAGSAVRAGVAPDLVALRAGGGVLLEQAG
jgi:hypothetical protein